jgi:serine/threonine-protein kinase
MGGSLSRRGRDSSAVRSLKAIRVIDSSGEFADRLLREARVIAQLEHPGIVPVHDVGTLPDGRVFYTMKLVQGQRLDQYITEAGGVQSA